MDWQAVYCDIKVFLKNNWKHIAAIVSILLVVIFLMWTCGKIATVEVEEQNKKLRGEIVNLNEELGEVKTFLSNKEKEVETLKEGGSEAVASVERLTEDKTTLQRRVEELEEEVATAKDKYGIQVGPNLSQDQLDAGFMMWIGSVRSHLSSSAVDVLSPAQKNILLNRALTDLGKAQNFLNQDSSQELHNMVTDLATQIGGARPRVQLPPPQQPQQPPTPTGGDPNK